jgi:hypothetical protein
MSQTVEATPHRERQSFDPNSDPRVNLSQTPERLIGLLDLPDIVAGGCGPAPSRTTTRAFATPSQNGRSVGTIYWREERDVVCQLMIQKADGVKDGVPTLESGYEIPAAVVFERRGPWFRIGLKEGSAWIRRTDPKDFLPFSIARRNPQRAKLLITRQGISTAPQKMGSHCGVFQYL